MAHTVKTPWTALARKALALAPFIAILVIVAPMFESSQLPAGEQDLWLSPSIFIALVVLGCAMMPRVSTPTAIGMLLGLGAGPIWALIEISSIDWAPGYGGADGLLRYGFQRMSVVFYSSVGAVGGAVIGGCLGKIVNRLRRRGRAARASGKPDTADDPPADTPPCATDDDPEK